MNSKKVKDEVLCYCEGVSNSEFQGIFTVNIPEQLPMSFELHTCNNCLKLSSWPDECLTKFIEYGTEGDIKQFIKAHIRGK